MSIILILCGGDQGCRDCQISLWLNAVILLDYSVADYSVLTFSRVRLYQANSLQKDYSCVKLAIFLLSVLSRLQQREPLFLQTLCFYPERAIEKDSGRKWSRRLLLVNHWTQCMQPVTNPAADLPSTSHNTHRVTQQ